MKRFATKSATILSVCGALALTLGLSVANAQTAPAAASAPAVRVVAPPLSPYTTLPAGPVIPMQPYIINHETRVDSAADMRFLFEPIGDNDFIQVKNGHLYKPNGKRFRCWGTNMTGWDVGSEEIPSKQDADTFAAELPRLGINCIRLHFLDMSDTESQPRNEGAARGQTGPVTHRPRGLIRGDLNHTQEFNAERLDRLDYWIAQLKKNGVHVDFNLNVGRSYKPGDGVPDQQLVGNGKAYTYIGPELIALQKQYARDLLGHKNPYTGLRYADDPVVAIVEIVNENSIMEFWLRNWLRGERKPGGENVQLDLTSHYHKILIDRYNAWLTANRTPAQIAQLRAESGTPAGEPITIMNRTDWKQSSRLRLDAEVAFIASIEIDFHTDFVKFLRTEIGVKAPIIPLADHTYFIPNQPLMLSASKFDIVDSHVYWQHPAIYGKRNEPMINYPELSIVQKLARSSMVGKPFTVSEVNHPYPSEYDAEMIPILASYAAFQDWDGIFFYTFETKVHGKWTPMIGDHFDMTQHPGKMAQMPVGAMIFLRGDVSAAKTVLTRSYSTADISEASRSDRSTLPYYTPGFDISIPLTHGSRVACLNCPSTLPKPLPKANPIVSDTGELSWRTNGDNKDGLLSIDSPRTQGLVGFIRANPKIKTTHLSADILNDFGSITLSSLDGKPVRTSNSLMLTVVGKSENSGTVWNDRRTMLTKWGTAPTLIEPITGWVQLRDLDGAVGVVATPIDGAAKPNGPEVRAQMIEPGWELQVGGTPTTTYLLRVIR